MPPATGSLWGYGTEPSEHTILADSAAFPSFARRCEDSPLVTAFNSRRRQTTSELQIVN